MFKWRETVILVALMFLHASAIAWDPIKDITGKRGDEHAKDLGDSVGKFAKDPIKYPMERAGEVFNDICSLPARMTVAYAANGGRGLRSLPNWFMERAQPFYSVNLNTVGVSEGASVINARAVTDKGNVYVSGSLNWSDLADVQLMLHELEHVVQYHTRGGSRSRMGCEYLGQTIGAGFKHDDISMEQAADRKARNVLASWNRQPSQQAYPPVQRVSGICRAGAYWALVPAAPVGTGCGFYVPGVYSYQQVWINGVRTVR